MFKKVIFIILIVCLSFTAFSLENNDSKNYTCFGSRDYDKYYNGWLDRRSSFPSISLNYNHGAIDALEKRDSSFDYTNIDLLVDLRVVTDIIFYRNNYFSFGLHGGGEILLFKRSERIDNVSFFLFDVSGEYSPFFDFWLKPLLGIDMKIRLHPYFHQSTHYADGFKGTIPYLASSFELFSLTTHYTKSINKHTFSPYGGMEITYRHAGSQGAPAFKFQLGNDYRYTLQKENDISFIAGLNAAYIYNYKDDLGLIDNQHSFAIALGAGVEFHNYKLAAKFKHEKGRGATNYFAYQTSIGIDLSMSL